MTWPIVELTFWNPGDGHNPRIDPLLADPTTPLAKHGLTGIATAYARETGVQMHENLARWAQELARRSIAVDGAVGEVANALLDGGISYFVAKGPAIAHDRDVYASPELRAYADLDVYTTGAQLASARAALRRHGYTSVPQRTGPLGGRGRELVGGSFGTVVEIHDSLVDNLHRSWLPPVEHFLSNVVERRICGVNVPTLRHRDHLDLQLVHLVLGHRYAKLGLYRDARAYARLVCGRTSEFHDIAGFESVVAHVVRASGVHWPVQPLEFRLTQSDRRLTRSLTRNDPCSWDELSLNRTNFLALMSHLSRSSWRRRTSMVAKGLVHATRTRGRSERSRQPSLRAQHEVRA